jgi:hypothetical protein
VSRMRTLIVGSILLLSLVVSAGVVRGDDPKPTPKPIPPIATTAEAKDAIAIFKAAFKGKDVEAKADAIDALGKVNHPFVVDELIKLVHHKDAEIVAAAYQNLAAQRAIPDVAGKAALSTVDPKAKASEHVTDVIDTVKGLNHRGSLPWLVTLFRNDDAAVVRWALDAVGDMKDVRAVDAVLDLIKELKIEEGVKWDGAEASVDTGVSGSADADAARAAAESAAKGNARKGKGGARHFRAVGDIVYMVLKDLTGESFGSGKAAREWIEKHKVEIDARKKALSDEQKAQEDAGKAAVAAAKAGK